MTSLPLIFQIGPEPAAGGSNEDWRTLLGTYNVGGGDAWVNASASEPGGDLFVAGTTTDQVFPANTGAVTHQGQQDVFYGRFDYAPGNASLDATILWMNYFGGTGKDVPIVAHFASDGRLYVGGWTDSEDIVPVPLTDPADGTFWQGVNKGQTDGFIIATDTTLGVVERFIYLGGSGDDMITAVTEDAFGELYWSGATTTASGSYGAGCTSPASGFPLCDPGGGAYQQTSNAGGTDAFVTKIDPDFFMDWSTFYGGTGNNLVYDAAYWSEPVGVQDRVILVGASKGAVPFVDSADFHLGGLSDSTGFIVTFDRGGRLKWETNIHGTTRLEAAAVHQDRLVVMGTTPEVVGGAPAITTAACAAVPGYLSICDPGGSAYTQNEVRLKDEYFAEFDMPDAQLTWATTYGGWTWEAADYTVALPEAHYQIHPFPIHRFGDLVFDGDGNLFTLGIIEQSSYPWVADTVSYPTLAAWDFYNRAWEDTMGNNQTDVSLKCFLADRSLYWSTTFGASFTHRTPDPWEDLVWLPLGCDWGTDLELVQGKALYWVGSSGGVDFDNACPYPGTSWCEPVLPFGSDLDFSHGFAARMNMSGVNVGIPEQIAGSTTTTGAWCFPNPTPDDLSIMLNGQLATHIRVRIFDATGRIVRESNTDAMGRVHVGDLSAGCYQVVLFHAQTRKATTRFIKDR